ncbi:family 43 glycosylhydrolase [Paenibacillus sp. LMG 31461]|uniref:Family 43 glycosylhydrolase n=1 Tax=Paenibacillus plantarum TaxID=2654975 RepID=A0ABX1X339_9BACL|nr:family 43 glycosylhydrolase [Paenibacillus plantarum]NOU62823.1 family 43 glycosylhydrolase [Paenibacillus plantarum]
MTNNSIKPGQVWLDTEGKRIHSHGGSIIYIDGTFYWYGENKEKSKPGSNIWHWGVRAYASQDLYNWEDKGLIIPPNLEDESSPLHPSKFLDRPHIIYNRFTKKYVCWLKIMQPDASQKSTVLVADDFLGPYTIVKEGIKPLGMSAGDFDMVVNPSDGKAYYYFERVHSEMICADLTDDYTDVTGYYSTHFPQSHPPYVREAPAHFYRDGLHYLVTSGTTGYFPNPSEVACSSLYHGPFEVLGNPHVGDATNTSFGSQICSVFKHPLKKDLYIALADRWVTEHTPGNPTTYEEAAERFDRIFNPKKGMDPTVDHFNPVDTTKSDFVWLPFRFDGKMAYLDWHDEWRIEDYE